MAAVALSARWNQLMKRDVHSNRPPEKRGSVFDKKVPWALRSLRTRTGAEST
jgi:hypothetical protein